MSVCPGQPKSQVEAMCAICELKNLVNKIGENLCSPNCKACVGGQVRPATAMPSMNYPSGDSALVQQPYVYYPTMPQAGYNQTQPYYQQPNWASMANGQWWRNNEREHPYLPVTQTLPRDERKIKNMQRIARAQSARNVAATELRASVMVGCDCTKKNGLQDACPKIVCKDMPRKGTLENPSKLACKEYPCQNEPSTPSSTEEIPICIEKECECKKDAPCKTAKGTGAGDSKPASKETRVKSPKKTEQTCRK